jgi:hypothetical protein
MHPMNKKPAEYFDPNKEYKLLSLDPGNERTGWALWSVEDGDRPSAAGDHPNAEIRQMLVMARDFCMLEQIVCEFPVPRGEQAKWQVFATCLEAGRFLQIISDNARHVERCEIPFYLADRSDVKVHLCRKANAKDKDVREALLNRFGGKEAALTKGTCPDCKGKGTKPIEGKKKVRSSCWTCAGHGKIAPGPLVHIVGDAWSALAVGICWRDGALPDEAERKRRELNKANERAQKAARAAKRLIDKASISGAVTQS